MNIRSRASGWSDGPLRREAVRWLREGEITDIKVEAPEVFVALQHARNNANWAAIPT